jgi:hypothetical protein
MCCNFVCYGNVLCAIIIVLICLNIGTANSTRLLGHNLSRKAGAQKEQRLICINIGTANITQLLGHNLSRKAGAQKEQRFSLRK